MAEFPLARTALDHRRAAYEMRIERVSAQQDLLALTRVRAQRPLFYWEQPHAQLAIAAFGRAASIVCSGADRLRAAGAQAADLLAQVCVLDAPAKSPAPFLVGGFAFADEPVRCGPWREMPALEFVLPLETWLRRNGELWRFVIEAVHEGAPRVGGAVMKAWSAPAVALSALDTRAQEEAGDEASRFLTRVNHALSRIERGELEKVVLARRRRLHFARPVDVAAMVDRLRGDRPQCTTFWLGFERTHFVGSTPESLVRVRGRTVCAHALAGTRPRARDDAADERMRRALLASEKDRREHEAVVREIEARLASLAHRIRTDAEPTVTSVPEAHHLSTRICADLTDDLNPLAIAAALHPTPAVCGTPTEAAARLIANEEADRGWYSGAVGWIDAAGDGELAVALRSAAIDGNVAELWAGAGIVAGSVASSELAETETKLRAAAEAFKEQA